jgi:hypothetical protein
MWKLQSQEEEEKILDKRGRWMKKYRRKERNRLT